MFDLAPNPPRRDPAAAHAPTVAPPTPTPTPTATATPTASATATATVSATPTATAPVSSSTPDSRATTFVAVEGGTETRSGEALLVSAYTVLWLIMMAWVVLVWRKQAGINGRIDDLERAIDRAAVKAEKAAKQDQSGKKD